MRDTNDTPPDSEEPDDSPASGLGPEPPDDPPADKGGGSVEGGAPRRRVRRIDPDHLGTFRWLEGVTGQALATTLRGRPVGDDRMDVGPAGRFLTILDHLTRLLAAHHAGTEPKSTGTIARPEGVSRLQLAEATAGASITLYFAVDEPTQITIEGGITLYDSPMGRAVADLIDLIERGDDDERLIEKSHALGDRIADRYYELVEFLSNEQLDVRWQPVDRPGADVPAHAASEIKAVLNRELADEVGTTTVRGRLYEANARTSGFQLETDDGERIEGEYDEDLTALIRTAWNREVEATLRVVHRRRARSLTPFKTDYYLQDVSPQGEGAQ